MNTQTIALDVSKATAVPPAIHIRQGDKNGTILNVGIFDNGTALNLTSLPVRMCAKLPDGVHYYSVNGTASGNTATFEIDESYAAAYPGITDLAYIDVMDGDDIICSTQPFRIVVEPSARDAVIPSDEYISEIDAAVERCHTAAQECEDLAHPITEAQIDSIVADTSVTSDNKMTATNLTYFWGKLKAAFASITHTHSNAAASSGGTGGSAGFMSATDKEKLDGIASGAQVNSITGVKGDSESTYRTGNVNITAANVGAAAASHDHSGDALVPASVAATGAVSGSSISDGTGTLAQLRESVNQLIKVNRKSFPTTTVPANSHAFSSMSIPAVSGYSFAFICEPNTNTQRVVVQSLQVSADLSTAYIGCYNTTSAAISTTPAATLVYVRTQALAN